MDRVGQGSAEQKKKKKKKILAGRPGARWRGARAGRRAR